MTSAHENAAAPFAPVAGTGVQAPHTRRYQVMHRTSYSYNDEVSSSYGRCYLRPRDLPHQRVLTAGVMIKPEPNDRSTGVDVYGNSDAYFHVRSDHTELVVVAESLVEVDPVDPALFVTPGATGPWEQARPGPLGSAVLREFAMDLYPPEITPAVRAYASRVFVPGRPLAEAVRDLTTRIFHDFTYESGSTAISTKVDTVLERRKGVCQDFARVALACLRSVGLAGRYESGYLATDPPPGRERIYGADASHAWAAVWVPGETPGAETPGPGYWLAFDPTNDKWVDERHVTVAWGRDYDDVPPLRGVIYTDSTRSEISVSVDVCPVDPV
ncbi:MAG: transglutaminase family protein [Gordonia sp.]|jgi:transglutaminase-like putative cysteine protease|nr:transglutaminase family protein [Gordonia sp. (in: high G+C Gram-positive bacteria)]